jgi:hypothetical protein
MGTRGGARGEGPSGQLARRDAPIRAGRIPQSRESVQRVTVWGLEALKEIEHAHAGGAAVEHRQLAQLIANARSEAYKAPVSTTWQTPAKTRGRPATPAARAREEDPVATERSRR